MSSIGDSPAQDDKQHLVEKSCCSRDVLRKSTKRNEEHWWDQRSDLSKWCLKVQEGRQTWHYCEDVHFQRSFVEKYHLGQLSQKDIDAIKCSTTSSPLACVNFIDDALYDTSRRSASLGIEFYQQTQTEDGHFAGDYSGPMFLLPEFIIVMYVTRTLEAVLSIHHRKELVHYLRIHISPEPLSSSTETPDYTQLDESDSKETNLNSAGWGLHIEGPPTMLGTCLNYVALRLLGVPSQESFMQQALRFIRRHGGAEYLPSWGKFYLAILNACEWDGVTPILPELWILPDKSPFHPSKIWCHTRQVYLPMSFIYGLKLKAPLDPLILSLREEIYCRPYKNIDWPACSSRVCPLDSYNRIGTFCKLVCYLSNFTEKWLIPARLRQAALRTVISHIKADNENTKCISIGPVSKMLNMLSIYYSDGPNSASFKDHIYRISDYLWLGMDGLKVQGTNGSQVWDTSFAVQAFLENRCAYGTKKFLECLNQCFSFLKFSQILENTPHHTTFYRHISKGGWSFSTRDCGWIVSDCTAEALKAILLMKKATKYIDLTVDISDSRLFNSVDLLLSLQNEDDGGFPTYEHQRGSSFYEWFNPSEVFSDIMIDYSYVECTSSCVQALHTFREVYPNYRTNELIHSMNRSLDFIKKIQRSDGSWYGSWGICFTYGTWFGLEALACLGEYYSNSDSVRRACSFLISKQNPDGSWGETYKSCELKEYSQNRSGQLVNTSWAALGLMIARFPVRSPIEAAIKFIINKQDSWGNWPQEDIKGCFNRACAIMYPNFCNIFPIWTLGRFTNLLDFGFSPITNSIDI